MYRRCFPSEVFTVKNNLGGVVPYVIVRTNQKEVDPLLGSISETVPSNPEEGDFWYQVDHSAQTVTLMKYSGSAWRLRQRNSR